ncbi:MAG: phospho-N-acetylmuramoyl-pentapeptide-transferase [Phycisphaerales bacterium]|nr:phospho-N-acetylmuramoyl-pentapeptide-transferase [Phycisphaerales bacterium]
MIYGLIKWLQHDYNNLFFRLIMYTSVRVCLSIVLSLLIAIFWGGKLIAFLRTKQIGEDIRELGLEGQLQKKGTPTMGGLIIITSILIPTLLFADLHKVYIQLMILCTVCLGGIGFLDDRLKLVAKKKALQSGKVYNKQDADGLAGTTKIIGQVLVGVVVASMLYFNNSIVVERELVPDHDVMVLEKGEHILGDSVITRVNDGISKRFIKVKTPITTIPFVKGHEFNYSRLISWIGHGAEKYTWIIYILIITFIITAVSNGANITDGLDGLLTGTSAIIGLVIGVFVYVSGHYKLAFYLNIMYIPSVSELSIFIAAFIGACIGFLWYNAYPAQVFMGDTGSLALGGIIATLAIVVRKELLIPIFCGVFLVENLSVMLQVGYFKYTKRKYGAGKRIFLLSPLHHHYQKKGIPENKIVVRFWIVSILLAVASVLTLKIR